MKSPIRPSSTFPGGPSHCRCTPTQVPHFPWKPQESKTITASGVSSSQPTWMARSQIGDRWSQVEEPTG